MSSEVLSCHDADMAFPPQTPGYQGRLLKQFRRPDWMQRVGFLLFIGGGIGWEERRVVPGVLSVGVMVIGVVVLVVHLLNRSLRGRAAVAAYKKDLALRKPGTVELLTARSALIPDSDGDKWKLGSDMQIRLDSGPAFRGHYCTWTGAGPTHLRPEVRPFDSWFHVGASLRCLYDPANPDRVYVFPHAAPDDALPGDWPAVASGQLDEPIVSAESEEGHLFSSAT
jgi:hypothetical protein